MLCRAVSERNLPASMEISYIVVEQTDSKQVDKELQIWLTTVNKTKAV